MSEFHKILKSLRTSKGLLQKEVAEKLGISVSAYSLYENGTREPSIDRIISIANLFGISVNELMGANIEQSDRQPRTIAAHFDGKDFTEEELKKIEEYAELLKAARPALDRLAEYATTGLDDLLVPDKEETE